MSSSSATSFLLLYYISLYTVHHYGPSYKFSHYIFAKYVSRYSKSDNNDFLYFKSVYRTFVLLSMYATKLRCGGQLLLLARLVQGLEHSHNIRKLVLSLTFVPNVALVAQPLVDGLLSDCCSLSLLPFVSNITKPRLTFATTARSTISLTTTVICIA